MKKISTFAFSAAPTVRETMDNRHSIALILLILFVSATGVSSLHRHEEHLLPACEDCVHHHPHAGHLYDGDNDLDDCLLCHFLALPLIAAVLIGWKAASQSATRITPPCPGRPVNKILFQILLRGPPALS